MNIYIYLRPGYGVLCSDTTTAGVVTNKNDRMISMLSILTTTPLTCQVRSFAVGHAFLLFNERVLIAEEPRKPAEVAVILPPVRCCCVWSVALKVFFIVAKPINGRKIYMFPIPSRVGISVRP